MASRPNLSMRERERHHPSLISVVFSLFPSLGSPTPGSKMKTAHQGGEEEKQSDPKREEIQTCFAKVVIWLYFWDVSVPHEINYCRPSQFKDLRKTSCFGKKQKHIKDVCFVLCWSISSDMTTTVYDTVSTSRGLEFYFWYVLFFKISFQLGFVACFF